MISRQRDGVEIVVRKCDESKDSERNLQCTLLRAAVTGPIFTSVSGHGGVQQRQELPHPSPTVSQTGSPRTGFVTQIFVLLNRASYSRLVN